MEHKTLDLAMEWKELLAVRRRLPKGGTNGVGIEIYSDLVRRQCGNAFYGLVFYDARQSILAKMVAAKRRLPL